MSHMLKYVYVKISDGIFKTPNVSESILTKNLLSKILGAPIQNIGGQLLPLLPFSYFTVEYILLVYSETIRTHFSVDNWYAVSVLILQQLPHRALWCGDQGSIHTRQPR